MVHMYANMFVVINAYIVVFKELHNQKLLDSMIPKQV